VLDGGETHHDRKVLVQRHGFDLALDEFDFGMRIIDAAIETGQVGLRKLVGQKTKKVSVSAAYIQNRVRWWLLLDDAGKTFEISVIGVLKPVAMRRGEIGRIVGLEWNMRLKPAESMAACNRIGTGRLRGVARRCGKHRHKLDTESMSRNRTWRSQQYGSDSQPLRSPWFRYDVVQGAVSNFCI